MSSIDQDTISVVFVRAPNDRRPPPSTVLLLPLSLIDGPELTTERQPPEPPEKRAGGRPGSSALPVTQSEGWEREDDLARAERLTELLPGPFAGVYWDTAGGEIVVNVPERGRRIAEVLTAAYRMEDRDTPIGVRIVDLTMVELTELLDRARRDNYSWLGPAAAHVTGSQVDPRLNGVYVDLDLQPTQDMAAAATERFGGKVVLRLDPRRTRWS